jgi:hypothetical protein
MTHDYEPDALLLSLARLPSAAPRAERDARIRMRCHSALARRHAARQRAIRTKVMLARLADAALTAVLCGYATMALVEAFHLMK